MLENSPYLAPVVKAIILALRDAVDYLPKDKETEVVVVGAQGFVGNKVMQVLSEMDYPVAGVEKDTEDWLEKVRTADVVISATGEEKIIDGEKIQDGAIVIDVGSPEPDVDRESVEGKASFLSPVPGGVGPLTVILLIENLIEASVY